MVIFGNPSASVLTISAPQKRYRAFSLPGQFASRSESANRTLARLTGHTKICRHHGTHGTHGTDFIGCRRGKGGASIGTGAMRDQCHVTKLKELHRHPGATVCWQKYSPYCYNAEVTNKRWKPTMSEQQITVEISKRIGLCV